MDPTWIAFAVGVFTYGVLDIWFTLTWIRYDIEANPFIEWVYWHFGVAGLVIGKAIVLIAIGVIHYLYGAFLLTAEIAIVGCGIVAWNTWLAMRLNLVFDTRRGQLRAQIK